jgi:hypothetical protein
MIARWQAFREGLGVEVPPSLPDAIRAALAKMTAGERQDVFDGYCGHCGHCGGVKRGGSCICEYDD